VAQVADLKGVAMRRSWLFGSTRWTWLGSVLVMSLVVVLVGAQAAAGGGSQGRALQTDTLTSHQASAATWVTPPDQPALDAAADDARAVAGDSYFTDVAIQTDTNVVDVYLSDAPQAVLDRLQALHPGTYVFHNAAAHPRSPLLKLEAAISARVSSWAAAGVRIGYLQPTPDGYLEIGVRSDVGTAASKLGAAYGKGWIRVVWDGEPAVFTTYRYSDVSPWNGGDFIYHRSSASSWSDCSSGVPVHDTGNGTDYMLTASHCFWGFGGVGTNVRNGYVRLDNNDVYAGSSTTLIGSVTKNSNVSAGTTSLDVAFIQAPGSSVDFNGAWNTQGRAAQIGRASNNVGDQICASGAFDGQICGGLTVRALDQTVCGDEGWGTFCVNHEAKANSSTSGAVANGAGDSGGPVYSYSGSNLLVRGMIDAGSGGVSCNSNPTGWAGRACYHTLYFVEMYWIDNNWGVAPNT
jgi:hypothetical protein